MLSGIKLKIKIKIKKQRERELENESCACWYWKPGTFLNEGDKTNKRRGIEIRTTCGVEKQEKKKKKRMDEMKTEKGEII